MVALAEPKPTMHPAARSDLLLAVPASLFVLATALVIDAAAAWGTTFSGSSVAALAADLAAGAGLLLAGVLWVGQPTSRVAGWLLLAAGVVWFAPDWVGWQQGDPLARSVAGVVQPLLALFLACAVALPLVERPGAGRWRALLLLAIGGTLVVSLALALVDDPRLDSNCWSNCSDNVLVAFPDPGLASVLRGASSLGVVLSGILLAGVAIRRASEASPAGRRLLTPIAAPAVMVGLLLSVRGVVLLFRPMQDPGGFPDLALYIAIAWCTCGLAAGFAWRALRAAHVERLVAEQVQGLPATGSPGSMAVAIRSAVGDPTLVLLYRLGPQIHWMDDAGATAQKPESDHRTVVAPLTVDGAVVGAIVHDREIMEGGVIARRLGAAGRLAIENERLQVEVGEHLRDLGDSRARIVRRTDEERRRLERDLHDGAQQRLLALSFDLRMARAAALGDGDPDLVAMLERSIDDARAAHEALRDLAHGLFPAVLAENGLEPALQTLADRVPLVVDLDVAPGRLRQDLETAAYAVAREAIEDSVSRAAGHASLTIAIRSSALEILLTDDGTPLRSAPADLADRVGAAGGSIEIDEGAEPNQLRVRLPCG